MPCRPIADGAPVWSRDWKGGSVRRGAAGIIPCCLSNDALSLRLDACLVHRLRSPGGPRHQFLRLRVTRLGEQAVGFAGWLSHCTSSPGARANGRNGAELAPSSATLSSDRRSCPIWAPT
jgi:hypothetical protein